MNCLLNFVKFLAHGIYHNIDLPKLLILWTIKYWNDLQVTVEGKSPKGGTFVPFTKTDYCKLFDYFGVTRFKCPFKKTVSKLRFYSNKKNRHKLLPFSYNQRDVFVINSRRWVAYHPSNHFWKMSSESLP